ncbi:HAD family hydrolase [Blautia sp. HCP3S3_H10_1]|uniref:HAD family hydrolase n=1 Tax=unclassified Blautia TaxID=2648079 RepID=UPI003F930FC3
MMKTIIFDIDGTLFDTKSGIIHCLNDILDSYGCKKINEREEDKYIGPAIKDSLIKFNGFSDEIAMEATRKYRKKYVTKYVGESRPYKGLEDLLKYLKKNNYRICIATMKTKPQVEKLFELFGISAFFEYIEVAKEKGGYTKINMLENIKAKYPYDKMLFVGDTIGDYTASVKAEIPFVYAKYGYGRVLGIKCTTINSLLELRLLL